MYAIVETGGKQYKVREGETIFVEKLPHDDGEEVSFDRVLMVKTDAETRVGTPHVEGATVTGTLVEQGKAKKIIVFKYKKRKKYRKKQGHRQPYSRVKIDKINLG